MKNIVIVGGGSAGWLTALYTQRIFPEKNITVIESSEIGILGAGEGTTPHLINLLDFLGVEITDIILNCDATIKNGIKFTNWNGDGKYYYHSFGADSDLDFNAVKIHERAIAFPSAILSAIHLEGTTAGIDFSQKVSEVNKVPFYINPPDYRFHGHYSIHFNASKLANRLKEIAVSRNISVIDSKIEDFILDENKNIKQIVIENNQKIESDFIFDCSGFHRLIIGKLFNSQWKSHSEHLPVDTGLPFFIEMDKEIPPYTEAIAMKYGWVWKIPLQSRYGCGYVYDSSLITEEEAIIELENYLGFEPEYPRKNKGSFKFKAGYYEEPWINNCIAVGLSAGFIEPLEATSIWISMMALQRVLSSPEILYHNNERIRNEFNKFFKKINDEVVDFIYFHYMTDRKDTEFWNKFSIENAPKDVKEMLSIWDYRLPIFSDSSGKIWSIHSWLSVASGINKINKKIIDEVCEYSNAQKYGLSLYNDLKIRQEDVAKTCDNHNDFIKRIVK